MKVVLLAIVLVLVPIALFVWLRAPSGPRQMTRQQAAAALANALDLDGAGNHDEFDFFLGREIADPYLESIRQECLVIIRSDLKPLPGRDLGPRAEEWAQRRLAELQKNSHTGSA